MANRKYANAVQERKAKNRITRKYHVRAMKAYTFRFHKVNDADVIAKLDSSTNKNDYIRRLILKDIAEKAKEGE